MKDGNLARPTSRGPESWKLSNSMTWSDQNCPTKDAYFAIFFLTGKVRNILRHFLKVLFYLQRVKYSVYD